MSSEQRLFIQALPFCANSGKEENMTDNNVPSWDLSDLYNGPDDGRIEADLQQAENLAIAFKASYRGRIKAEDLNADLLCQALADYQAILELLYKADSYADLLFAADTSKPENGALMQKVSERVSQISTHLIFIDLELGQISDSLWEKLQKDGRLAEYRHTIEQERLQHKYALSEAEETILEETANCRGRAFARLFTETVSRLKFPITIGGETKELNQSELSALFYKPDRELRRQAAQVQSQVLQEHIHPLHFAYSTIILEKLTMNRLRGFTYPEESRHLANELPAAAIETMVNVVVQNYASVARFYRLKKQLLGLDELFHYDRYAPLPQKSQAEVSFAQAKQTVLEAFGEFSPLFREKAETFFSQGWIDALMRSGKRGGAFCAGITPSLHPYILMNFTSTPRDVETLAHELGHGIHDILASKQNIFNYHPVLPLAETASTFCELLVFHKLLKELPDAASKLALASEHLESLFATVFRQVAMYRFEQRVFRRRSEQGELTHEQMSDIWQDSLQEMFGDSVTMGEDHRITWSYIPHFIHTPFYVYAYAFGELLVLALYARYRQEGAPFIEKYIEFLSSGGALTPQEMLAKLNIDITKAEFWQGGCDLIQEEIKEAEALAAALHENAAEDNPVSSGGWGEGDNDGWDGYGEDEGDIMAARPDWDEE